MIAPRRNRATHELRPNWIPFPS